MILVDVEKRLLSLADPVQAGFLRKFFKTGPGQYGAGDLFRGIRVPALRALARDCRMLPLDEIVTLLRSVYHEDRLLALLLLVHRFGTGDELQRDGIYRLYLGNTRYINNWDLVDVSAEHVVGGYLYDRSREPLELLARSSSLWERRIAILATFHFIRRGDFDATIAIAEMLVTDREDLIHKAVGWMLREVGKRDLPAEVAFLDRHHRTMPRTMLRYAIERFPEAERAQYLKGVVLRS